MSIFTRKRIGAVKYLAVVGLGLLLLAVSISAKPQTNTGGTEVLILPPYPSQPEWKEVTRKISNKKHEHLELVEWVPVDQSKSKYRDILSKRVLYDSKNEDPRKTVGVFVFLNLVDCAQISRHVSKTEIENGFPVVYGQIFCVGNKKTREDVDTFMKVMSGKEALYIVWREFHRSAQPGAMPGITEFSSDQVEEMKARIEARNVATKFLSHDVQLCPAVNGTAACSMNTMPLDSAATPKDSK